MITVDEALARFRAARADHASATQRWRDAGAAVDVAARARDRAAKELVEAGTALLGAAGPGDVVVRAVLGKDGAA